MAKLSAGSGVCRRYYLSLLMLSLSATLFLSFAKTVTVDADDASANYQTLSALLTAIGSATDTSELPDTVLFAGTNQHVYTWSTYSSPPTGNKQINFVGAINNPDSFPIIVHSSTTETGYNFFIKAHTSFEKLTFTGSVAFDNGQYNRNLLFKRCVIRDYTSKFFVLAGDYTPSINFDNCLFINNTDSIFKVNFYATSGNGPKLEIINCTFDNNAGLFNSGTYTKVVNTVIKNNIFNNTPTTNIAVVKAVIANCLTTESTSGYGSGNVQLAASDSSTLFVKQPAARLVDTLASAWKLGSTSKAKNFVSTPYSRITVDIEGTSRGTTTTDAGCWKFDNSLLITTQPVSDTVVTGTNALFTIVIGGSESSLAWFRKGSTDTLGTNDTLTVAATGALDSSRYYCVVSNSGGSVVSDTVTLRVISKPVIVTDSAQTVQVANGDSVTLSIKATGLQLVYHWYIDSILVTGTDSLLPVLKITTVTRALHDGKTVYCVVSNPAGTTSALPDTFKVIANPPKITVEPVNDTVYVSDTAKFTVVATGVGMLSYTWFSIDTATMVRHITGTNAATLTIPSAAMLQNGTAYVCYVASPYGDSTASRIVYLTVKAISAPVITDQTQKIETRVGKTVSMYVVYDSIPNITYTVQWYFGTAPIAGATSKVLTISSIKATDAGTYYCQIKNAIDSTKSKNIIVTVRGENEIYNPITLKAYFVDRTKIKLTIKNFLNLPSSTTLATYVDTIGIWYKYGDYPVTPDRSSDKRIFIPLSTILQKCGGTIDSVDTVLSITMGTDPCDTFSFVAAPFWKTNDTIAPFNTDLGARVYSCSTVPVANPLTLSVVQGTKDTVVLSVNGFTSITKSDVLNIVYYYVKSDTAVSTIVLPELFPAGNTYTVKIQDPLFATVQKEVTWGAYIRGAGGNVSDTVKGKFAIGYPRPVNDLTLLEESRLSDEVTLKWTLVSQYDSIRVLYGTDTIPITSGEVSLAKLSTIKIKGTDTNVVVGNLQQETTYNFGLQVQRNGIWSGTTVAACLRLKTGSSDTSKISNTIDIVESYFDTSTNMIVVKYTFDSTGTGKTKFDCGYVLSTFNYVTHITPANSFKITKFIGMPDTNTLTIDLGDSLDFDTTYYIAMWAKATGGSWSLPVDSSMCKVRTGPLNWIRITVFNPDVDTLKTFEKQIKIWKGQTATFDSVAGYIDRYQAQSGLSFNGFIPVSDMVKFRKAKDLVTPDLHFGIRVDSVPHGYSLNDINMYEYDTLAKKFKMLYNRDSAETDSFVSITTKLSSVSLPVILMVDTLKPVLSLVDTFNQDSAVDAGSDIIYKVKLDDNVGNLSTLFKYSIGGDSISNTTDTVVTGADVSFRVLASFVSNTSGVYATLIITDGHFRDTVNLSRVVKNTYVVNTLDSAWYPLCVHYDVNNLKVSQFFDSLSGPEKKYDKTKFRIFKWYDDTVNYKPQVGRYIEFDKIKETDSLMDLTPGNLLWVKTRKSTKLNFGNVQTLSLRKNYSVKLLPNTWTDVAVPFSFGIKIGDIITASGLDTLSNKLIINKWNKDKNSYVSTVLHSPLTGESHEDSTMYEVYTIYNNVRGTKSKDTIQLEFPPLPWQRSGYHSTGSVAKKASSGVWNFTVTAHTADEVLNPVYCGYNPDDAGLKKTMIPVAPSLSSVKMGINNNGGLYCINVSHEKTDGETYILQFNNNAAIKQTVNCQVEQSDVTGKLFKLFNPATGEATDVSSEFTVDVDNQSTAQRYLLVGTSAFINNAVVQYGRGLEFALLQLYPNPFHGAVHIKYSIPLVGVKTVDCMLFDPLGRMIWNFNIDKNLRPGSINTFTWVPGQNSVKKLASGTYFLKLVARDEKGRISNAKQAKLMYLSN